MEFRYDYDEYRKDSEISNRDTSERMRENMKPRKKKKKKNILPVLMAATVFCLLCITMYSMNENAAQIALESAADDLETVNQYTDWSSDIPAEEAGSETIEESTTALTEEKTVAETEETSVTETIGSTEASTESFPETTETVETSSETENTSSASEEQEETTAATLEYTANAIPDVSSCLKVKSFAKAEAPDGSYSFVYPKYLFNHCELKTDGSSGYTLSYVGESSEPYTLSIYSKDNAGDALKKVKSLYRKFKKQADEYEEIAPPWKSEESGFARAVLVSSVGEHSNYIVIANDGKKNYVMIYTYESTDYADYIIECLYRGCSFSGSTKNLRSYKKFSSHN